MHIGIDCRFAGAHAGLGRYTREIVRHLLRSKPEVRFSLFVRDANEPWISDVSALAPNIIVAPFAHYSVAEQLQFPSVVQRAHPDLLFSPHFNVPLRCSVPFVATIHDLILHRFPNDASYAKQWAYRVLLHATLSRARRLIAVSTFTALEMGGVYGGSILRKTEVISEGVDASFVPRARLEQQELRTRLGIEHPFFLYVGNAKEHKNVPMLLEAFRTAAVPDTELLLLSGGPEIRRLALPPGVRILQNISDDDLPVLYSAARAFVTASLYEGFCLPVAEALACGCPVIATNRGAIPEIAAGRAILLEPDPAAFVAALRSSQFPLPSGTVPRWQRAAERTFAVLQSALDGSQ